MSEHGWPDLHDDGHHDDGLHHDDSHQEDLHHEEVPQDDPVHEETSYWDDAVHHESETTPEVHSWEPAHETHEDAEAVVHEPDLQEPPGHDTVGTDPDALPEPLTGEEVSTFPPILDVGPLPEPVDGFPWIDTGSLGLIDPDAVHAAATDQVDPHELAEYAGTELPPGADPWAELAGSEDPATSALAKWWSENS